MENVHLVLSLSIIVILFLIFSCSSGVSRNEGLKNKKSKCNNVILPDHHYHKSRQGKKDQELELAHQKSKKHIHNFDEWMQRVALEEEVIQSQELHNKESGDYARGPAHWITFSHENRLVPWVGLRRSHEPPTVSNGNGLQSVHSDHADQHPKYKPFVI